MNKQQAAVQIAAMKQQTFGVEVEMNNITREKASKVAEKFFRDRFNIGLQTSLCDYCGGSYDTWVAYDNRCRPWKFMSDCSIAGPYEERCELVTPILTYNDMDLFQELLRRMRKAGAHSDYTEGCGVHIHIGADLNEEGGHNAKTLRNLCNLMASHENLLIQAIDIEDFRTQRYCQTIDQHFLHQLNQEKPKTMYDFERIWYNAQGSRVDHRHYNETRYHQLNLHATFTKGTIEFRLFQFDPPKDGKKNGIHAGKMKSYIQLCLAMSQRAKAARSISPIQPDSVRENPKFAMKTWLDQMACMGDEFNTMRKVLYDRLPGDVSFRHGEAQRQEAQARTRARAAAAAT